MPSVSVAEAERVPCPHCMAGSGMACRGDGGRQRDGIHLERYWHAERYPPDDVTPAAPRPQPYDPEPAIPIDHPGRVMHPLDDAACRRGLAGIEAARAALANHQERKRL